MKLWAKLATAVSSLLLPIPQSTVHVIGDVYLDVIAKVDSLPAWDGDTSIRSPIETVAGGSGLNTAVQLSALLRTRRQRAQLRPFRRCILHSRIGSDLYGDLVARKIREAGVAMSATRTGAQGICICLSGQRDRSYQHRGSNTCRFQLTAAFVILTKPLHPSRRRFISYKGTVSDFNANDINMAHLLQPGSSHVHFSAYFDCVGLQPAVPTLMARAKAGGSTISIVPQSDSAGLWASGLLELLPNIDVPLQRLTNTMHAATRMMSSRVSCTSQHFHKCFACHRYSYVTRERLQLLQA